MNETFGSPQLGFTASEALLMKVVFTWLSMKVGWCCEKLFAPSNIPSKEEHEGAVNREMARLEEAEGEVMVRRSTVDRHRTGTLAPCRTELVWELGSSRRTNQFINN